MVEGSVFYLVFCSTLDALVYVIPVLCSLILRSLHGWVYVNPLKVRFEENSSGKAQPWFYICLTTYNPPLGSAAPRVIDDPQVYGIVVASFDK